MRPGSTSGRACALALSVFGIWAGAGTDAHAGTPDDFFGSIQDNATTAEMQAMSANGVASLRILVNWAAVEHTQGVRDWSYYDDLIGRSAAAGLQPLPLLLGVPTWISDRPSRPPIYTESQRAAWLSFTQALGERYGPKGLFWRQHPGIPAKPLKDWEVWNEPNLVGFWGNQRPNPRDYVDLLRLTRSGLRAANAKARIAIGGIYPPVRKRYGISMQKFLGRLYRVKGARKAFDAFALHPYAGNPKGVILLSRKARELMDSHRDRRTPIWITELGWTTGGVGWARSPFKATPASQARFLRLSFRSLLRARKQLRLQKLIWHSWRDSSLAGSNWTLHMGLVDSSGSAKPSLAAFRRLAR